MRTIAITRSVVFGSPPQQYSVTFRVGTQEHLIKIVGPGRGGERVTHWLNWRGKSFRPGCLAMTEQAVARFIELESSGSNADVVERGNDELAVAPRRPRITSGDAHERQLPVADRA